MNSDSLSSSVMRADESRRNTGLAPTATAAPTPTSRSQRTSAVGRFDGSCRGASAVDNEIKRAGKWKDGGIISATWKRVP